MYDLIVNIMKNNYILCSIDWTAIFTLGLLLVACCLDTIGKNS